MVNKEMGEQGRLLRLLRRIGTQINQTGGMSSSEQDRIKSELEWGIGFLSSEPRPNLSGLSSNFESSKEVAFNWRVPRTK